MPDGNYRENVYNALKGELKDSFTKTFEEFNASIDSEEGYSLKVYSALKGELGDSFGKTEEEFNTSLSLKKKEPTQLDSGGVTSVSEDGTSVRTPQKTTSNWDDINPDQFLSPNVAVSESTIPTGIIDPSLYEKGYMRTVKARESTNKNQPFGTKPSLIVLSSQTREEAIIANREFEIKKRMDELSKGDFAESQQEMMALETELQQASKQPEVSPEFESQINKMVVGDSNLKELIAPTSDVISKYLSNNPKEAERFGKRGEDGMTEDYKVELLIKSYNEELTGIENDLRVYEDRGFNDKILEINSLKDQILAQKSELDGLKNDPSAYEKKANEINTLITRLDHIASDEGFIKNKEQVLALYSKRDEVEEVAKTMFGVDEKYTAELKKYFNTEADKIESRKESEAFYKENPVLGQMNEVRKSVQNALIDYAVGSVELGGIIGKEISTTIGLTDDSEYSGGDAIFDNIHSFSENVLKSQQLDLGPLVKDGDLNTEALAPALASTITDMVLLLKGGKFVKGDVLTRAGKLTIAGKANMISRSMVLSSNDYYRDALKRGLSPGEAADYALSTGIAVAAAELISPNASWLKKGVVNSGLKRAVIGAGKKDAIKGIATEITKENLQEFSQSIIEKRGQAFSNAVTGTESFDTSITEDELMETVYLTTITTGLLHGFNSLKGGQKEEYRTGSLYELSKNPSKSQAIISDMVSEGEMTEKEGASLSQEVQMMAESRSEVVAGDVSKKKTTELTLLNYKRKQLLEKKKNTSDLFNKKIVKDIEAVEIQIEEAITGKKVVVEPEIKKDDKKEQVGIPSEKQVGKEPIQEKLDKGPSKEEVKASGIFQEEGKVKRLTAESLADVDVKDKEWGGKVLDKVEQWDAMLKKHSKETLGVNIPVVVARIALKSIKVSVKAGQSLRNAVKSAIVEVKKSDWYKKLNDDQKTEVDDSVLSLFFKEDSDLNKVVAEEIVKAETVGKKPVGKEVQKVIEKTTFKPQEEFVRMQEKTFIKETLKTLSRGVRMGRADVKKEIKKVKDEVSRYASKYLPQTGMTKGDVQKMMNTIKNANKPSDLSKAISRIDSLISVKSAKSFESLIEKELSEKLVKSEGGIRKGKKVDVKTQEYLQEVKKELGADIIRLKEARKVIKGIEKKEAIEKRRLGVGKAKLKTSEDIDRLTNEIKSIEDKALSERRGLTDLELDSIVLKDLISRYKQASLMADSDPSKGQLLGEVYDLLQSLKGEGKHNLKQEIKKQHDEYVREKDEFLADIEGVKIADLKDQSKLDEARKRSDVGKKAPKLRDRVSNIINDYLLKHEDLSGLMDRISKGAGELMGGKTQELITDKIDDSSRNFKAGIEEQSEIIQDKAKDIYGKDWKKKLRSNSKPEDTGIAWINDQNLFLSQNQMYYIYNLNKDEANHAGLEAAGYDQKTIKELEPKLNPEVKEWADWLVDDFYLSGYDKYNETYKKIFRTNMPKNKKYAGRIYREGIEVSDINLLAGSQEFKTSIGVASVKERQANKKPIRIIDGDVALSGYVNDLEFFNSYAENLRNVQKLISDKDIKAAIKENNGGDLLRYLEHSIDTIAKRGVNNSKGAEFVNKLNDLFVTSQLGMNPTIFFKQLTSALAYTADIGLDNYIKHAPKSIANIRSDWKEIEKNSPYIRERYSESIKKTLETYTANRESSLVPDTKYKQIKSDVFEKLMYMIKAGDKGGIMGGIPLYNFHKDQYKKRNPKATEQEVIDYAVKKFEKSTKKAQQSSDLQDKDFTQTANSALRFFNMFKTSQKQYFRKEMSAIRQMKRIIMKQPGKGTFKENLYQFMLYHSALPMLFQYVSSGLPGLLTDFDEEDKEDLIRAGFVGNINSLFILGDMLDTFGDFIQKKPFAKMDVFPATSKIESFMKNATGFITEEDPSKANKKAYKAIESLIEAGTGLPIKNTKRYYDNLEKVISGKTKNLEEDILRIAGYSDYIIGSKKKGKKKTKVKVQ